MSYFIQDQEKLRSQIRAHGDLLVNQKLSCKDLGWRDDDDSDDDDCDNDDDDDDDDDDDGDIQVGVRHILDVEAQDWLLREDVAKGCY